jgi:hypothetical protein
MTPTVISAARLPQQKGRPTRWIPLVQRVIKLGQDSALIWKLSELRVEVSKKGRDQVRSGFYKAARSLGAKVAVQFLESDRVSVRYAGRVA